MNVNSSTSLSGLYAAQMQLDASAHNIANLNTEKFTRQEVAQSDTVTGGTNASVKTSGAGEGGNPEADMVLQIQSGHTYLANLSVFKTNNDMIGTLLNIRA